MYDKPNSKRIHAARKIFEMNKLSVSQSDGIVRKGDGGYNYATTDLALSLIHISEPTRPY